MDSIHAMKKYILCNLRLFFLVYAISIHHIKQKR